MHALRLPCLPAVPMMCRVGVVGRWLASACTFWGTLAQGPLNLVVLHARLCALQFKQGLAHEAAKYFDVFSFTYACQTTPEEKLRVRSEVVSIVAQYGTKSSAEASGSESCTRCHARDVYLCRTM